ncbi:parallel beta-helix domain-containing protein [Haliangium ochraceum]|uniref:Cytochrome-c peroxidase n=1 Tax=Haliangium ochraceum (strain DSM 14365 / JCM 11303 / SMP-2) TaxID=502025 RepID=D0LRC1_HALO1|nr:parallel beta-helix domain-containing protein [Haliangium ochraceum]ACY17149.1 Cytochrome-c peroxidase [Haliangium ochraceum DSM 14365]
MRMWKPIGLLVLGLALLLALLVFAPLPGFDGPELRGAEAEEIAARASEHWSKLREGRGLDRPFPPMKLRPDNPTRPERVELGRLLYFDPVLSGDNDVSCAHCHHPDLGLADNRQLSMGRGGAGLGQTRSGGAELRRNAPTVWNAAYSHLQFWDGRARDLEHQAEGPIQDANEMNQDPDELVRELRALPGYLSLFEQAFDRQGPEAISFQTITYAIAAFERTLVSNDSRYDRYAAGDHGALSESERRGLNVFRSLKTRCFECHNLPTFHNPDFKVIGVPPLAGSDSEDLGRAEILGGSGYEHAFKVPTLRNIALTAPYMHNGRFATLSEVIDFYANGGGAAFGVDPETLDDKVREFELSEQEHRDLIAFLHALTDESNKPAIPESVPSGLEVVPPLPNQSPELAAFVPAPPDAPATPVRREGNRLLVAPGERIQDAIDAARPGDIIEVQPGIYHETLTLDTVELRLLGVVSDTGERAILDGRNLLSDGIIGTARDVEITGFHLRNYQANGVMINLGSNIIMRDLRVENTGVYGLYPVEVYGILVEGCEVTGTRDAGIYVGQSRDILVRNNKVHGNVTGIEIENSVDAEVTGNEAYNNTAGILVFLLPNNPSKVAQRTVVRDNRVYGNNHENFGDPTAIVSRVPPGVGIIVLGADDTEITGNEVRDNRSFGIAISSLQTFLGDKAFDVDPMPENNWVHDNELINNGYDPAPMVTELGFPGADLLWDLSGSGNAWNQDAGSRLPYVLPGKDWSWVRRRANRRVWQMASKLL